uniref:Uncharacterized protein n=1 Tax=Haptolina ericina TaxID=156174 RepID=A0A7S3BUP5_9EUKA
MTGTIFCQMAAVALGSSRCDSATSPGSTHTKLLYAGGGRSPGEADAYGFHTTTSHGSGLPSMLAPLAVLKVSRGAAARRHGSLGLVSTRMMTSFSEGEAAGPM